MDAIKASVGTASLEKQCQSCISHFSDGGMKPQYSLTEADSNCIEVTTKTTKGVSPSTHTQGRIQVNACVKQLVVIVILVLPQLDNAVDHGGIANESWKAEMQGVFRCCVTG